MKYVLETDRLSKRYGRSIALDNLTMHIPKCAIYGFVAEAVRAKLRSFA